MSVCIQHSALVNELIKKIDMVIGKLEQYTEFIVQSMWELEEILQEEKHLLESLYSKQGNYENIKRYLMGVKSVASSLKEANEINIEVFMQIKVIFETQHLSYEDVLLYYQHASRNIDTTLSALKKYLVMYQLVTNRSPSLELSETLPVN